MLLDRDVFSGDKPVVPETIARLIVVRIAQQVVMKRPGPAWLAMR